MEREKDRRWLRELLDERDLLRARVAAFEAALRDIEQYPVGDDGYQDIAREALADRTGVNVREREQASIGPSPSVVCRLECEQIAVESNVFLPASSGTSGAAANGFESGVNGRECVDPVEAFNLLLQRLDKMIAVLEKIAAAVDDLGGTLEQ